MREAQFELSVERYIDAPPESVFKVWKEQLEQWWCPKPWTTEVIEVDLRPGGRFALVMRGPSGEREAQEGVFLEVVPNEKIVFTDAFAAGWVPQSPFMIGFFEIKPEGYGTRYRAGSRHWDEAAHKQHEEMGFEEGWTKVAEQLAQLAEQQS